MPILIHLTPDSTLEEICRSWRDDFQTQIQQGERKGKTETNYLYALGHLGDLRALPLSELTVPVIHAWHRALKKAHGKGPAYLAYAALRTMISWLRQQGVVQHNVAARIGITYKARQTLPLPTGIVVHTSAGWRPVGSKAGAPPHNGFMTITTWTQATINALIARDYLRVGSGSSMSLSGAGRDRALELKRRAAS